MIIEKISVLTETSDQLLEVELDGRPFLIRIVWNERFGYFSLSVLETDETPIVQNIKMVKNYPLVKRFSDVRLPTGDLYFLQENGKAERPGYSDLGVSFGLYYYEPDVIVTTTPIVNVAGEAVIGTIWDSGLTTFDVGVVGGPSLWDQ